MAEIPLLGFAFDPGLGITFGQAIVKYPLAKDYIARLRAINHRISISPLSAKALAAEEKERHTLVLVLASDIVNLLRQGKLIARGFQLGHMGVVEIPSLWWTSATVETNENWAEAFGVRIHGIRLFEAEGAIFDGPTPPSKGKKLPPTRGFKAADMPLIQEMRALIVAEKASGIMDAARQVVDRAAGGGLETSKIARLIQRYTELFSTAQF